VLVHVEVLLELKVPSTYYKVGNRNEAITTSPFNPNQVKNPNKKDIKNNGNSSSDTHIQAFARIRCISRRELFQLNTSILQPITANIPHGSRIRDKTAIKSTNNIDSSMDVIDHFAILKNLVVQS
jgi:hypothetical protein